MTDNADNNADAQELERLRTKNAELLAELKKVKAERDGLTTRVEAQDTEITDYKFNKPVADLLSKVLVSSKYSSQELAEHFTFALNDAGVLEMRDLEGKQVEVSEKVDGKTVTRPIKCEEDEVWRYLAHDYGKLNHIVRSSGASGGGASGSRSTPSAPQSRSEQKPSEFGLR